MDNINTVLTEKIRALRKNTGMTQEELADRLGVTFQAVSKWETGLCAPDITLLPDIADIFGVAIDELFGREKAESSSINAAPSELPWKDDGVFRGVIFKGRTLLSAQETSGVFTLCVEGDVKNLQGECDIKVEGDVHGNADAAGSIAVDGDVGGHCRTNGSAAIGGDIGGVCDCGGNATVGGDVGGNCSAGGNISVGGDIGGNCTAGGTIFTM